MHKGLKSLGAEKRFLVFVSHWNKGGYVIVDWYSRVHRNGEKGMRRFVFKKRKHHGVLWGVGSEKVT